MSPGAAHNLSFAFGDGEAGYIWPDSDPVRVVVAINDARTCELCNSVLNKAGYDVETISEEQQLQQILRSESSVILLIDESFAEAIKSDVSRESKTVLESGCKTILLEQRDGKLPSLKVWDATFDEVLSLPIHPHELLSRVRTMNQLQKLSQDNRDHMNIRAEQARMWSVLHEFARSASSNTGLDDLLEKLVVAASELTCSRRVSIMLPDENHEYLRIAKAIGIEEDVIKSVRVSIGDAVSGRAFELGRPVVAQNPNHTSYRKNAYAYTSFASFPMVYTSFKIGSRTVGVLNLTERVNDRPFAKWELEFVDVLGSIAGSTIEETYSRRSRDDAQDAIVTALATLAEYRDNDTGLHVERVTRFSLLIAGELQKESPYTNRIDEDYLECLRRAAQLHDIGKVAIPDAILLKPGKLSREEIRVVQTHAAIGRNAIRAILKSSSGVDFLRMAEDITGSHHEWFDGSSWGYPDGLKGEGIPLSARIVALAD
ncbi:MAG: HD domain-containing protein, partial [Planctomycetes bacterium]|nr:HD domain-containing protein [Planctomycetota bacterium]